MKLFFLWFSFLLSSTCSPHVNSESTANKSSCTTTAPIIYQEGLASRYHNSFQGNETAQGHLYDSLKLTAAHRKLPFGTKVKVVNKKTGKWVVVEINDRGPFFPTRVIDLSHTAADSIGITKHKGLGRVLLYIVD